MPKNIKSFHRDKLRVLLILSAIFNIVLGIVVFFGWQYSYVRQDIDRWAHVKAGFSPEVRHHLSRDLMRFQVEHADLEHAEIRARNRLIETMTARKYDEERYAKALDYFAQQRRDLADARADEHVKILQTLGRDDRKRIAEHLVRHYEGVSMDLKSDMAAEFEETKDEAWWNLGRYIKPKPSTKPDVAGKE